MTTPTPERTTEDPRPPRHPRHPRRDVERNRRRIVEAAREVLAQHGLALTLNEVARHAGLGVGTVYRHFPDKADLIDAALTDQLEAFVGIVEEGLSAGTAWESLVQILTRGMAGQVANRGLRDVALDIGPGDREAAVVGRIVPLMEGLVERAHAEGSLRPDVTLADITMMNFMVTELAEHGAEVQPDAYQRYLRLFIEALRARPDAGDLGPPLAAEVTGAIAEAWITSHRSRPR